MFHNNIYYTDTPILTGSFCEDLISRFNNDSRVVRGIVGNEFSFDQDSAIKRSDDLHISTTKGYKEEHNHMRDQLMISMREYQQLLEDQSPAFYPLLKNMKFAGFNIQRTKPGEFYNWHSDDHVMENGLYRGVTFIIYLNTIHNRGYTEFNDGTKIQPKQGHCLIFPSTWTYLHRGVPPVNEVKYIATGWCYYRDFVVTAYDDQHRLRDHPDIFK